MTIDTSEALLVERLLQRIDPLVVLCDDLVATRAVILALCRRILDLRMLKKTSK